MNVNEGVKKKGLVCNPQHFLNIRKKVGFEMNSRRGLK